jgi:hypothetical protein
VHINLLSLACTDPLYNSTSNPQIILLLCDMRRVILRTLYLQRHIRVSHTHCAEAVERDFLAVLRNGNPTANITEIKYHPKFFSGISSVHSVGDLIMDSEKFALLERLITGCPNQVSSPKYSLNCACELNVMVPFIDSVISCHPCSQFDRSYRVLHWNINAIPTRTVFSAFPAHPPQGIDLDLESVGPSLSDPMLLQSALVS